MTDKSQQAKAAEEQDQALSNLDRLEGITEPDESEQLAEELEADERQEQASQALADMRRQKAEAGAAMAVGFTKTLIKMRWHFVHLEQGGLDEIETRTADVLAKYDSGLPAWLEPYKEEIRLAYAVGAVGLGVYLQVQAHNAAQREQEQQQAEGESNAVPAE